MLGEGSEARNFRTMDRNHTNTSVADVTMYLGPFLSINRLGAFFNDIGHKALALGVNSSSFDAVVGRQTDDVDVRNVFGAQLVGQAGVGDARVLKGVVKGRVHFDLGHGALFDDAVEVLAVQLRDEFGAGAALDAVDGPQARRVRLGGVLGVDYEHGVDKGRAVGVVGGKGHVVGRVPVHGGELEGKGQGDQGVDGGGDGAAVGDGEGAVLGGVLAGGWVTVT